MGSRLGSSSIQVQLDLMRPCFQMNPTDLWANEWRSAIGDTLVGVRTFISVANDVLT